MKNLIRNKKSDLGKCQSDNCNNDATHKILGTPFVSCNNVECIYKLYLKNKELQQKAELNSSFA